MGSYTTHLIWLFIPGSSTSKPHRKGAEAQRAAKEGKPLMPSRQPLQTTLSVMALETTPEHESHDGFPHPPPLSRKRARGAS
jgi:hypothetical protein